MNHRGLGRMLDWLLRIRTRLLLVNLLIVAVPLIGIGFARFYEREMLRRLEQDMIDQGEILRQMLAADPTGLRLEDRGPVLAAAARETRTRIRLLGPDGQVRADSHAGGPPEGPESSPPTLLPRAWHASAEVPAQAPAPIDVSHRDEVVAALQGRYGATTRFWENRDTLYLFCALPIVREGSVQGAVYLTRSTNPVRAAMYGLRTKLIWILAGALAATAILSLFLAGTISRPLTRLTRVAERIAAGDRTVRIRLERRDEIGQLARAFDRMARKLDDRARDVAQLAADISHEFKSPLAGIKGAAELLVDGAADDPVARTQFLENILADEERLDRLVTRLLELSRVQADPAPDEVLDYEAVVREAAGRSHGPAKVEVVYRASRTQLRGRRAHLVSAVRNLVDNAQQHAAPGSAIEVRVCDGPGGSLRTSVHNRGDPITEANLVRIWDRFFTTRADQGGTGLGLPIVRAVIEAHGGSVSVRSSAEEGTTFEFDLPCTS